MMTGKDFDPQDFQRTVLRDVEILQYIEESEQQFDETRKLASKLSVKKKSPSWLLHFGMLKMAERFVGRGIKDMREDKKVAEFSALADGLMSQRVFKQNVCPLLSNAKNDAKEIASAITPRLSALVSAGTLSMPMDSRLFAVIAVKIAGLGAANFCAGSET